jgi:hypothetical protein
MQAVASLARLAVDTGGRLTERTNDLTLGYARAQRDLGCIYSVGFYDDDPVEDKIKNITIRVSRPGLRAIHASKFVFRSKKAKLESRLRAAFLSPELYETGVVRAHVFPLRPDSKKRWQGLLAVSFPVPLDELSGATVTREFAATLNTGPDYVHGFNRRMTLRTPESGPTEEPRITFLEPVELKPGPYVLTVVMSDPEGEHPHTARIDVNVPEIPRKELFLSGPMLGKAAGANLVITGGGPTPSDDSVGRDRSFEPLMVSKFDGSVDLVALTEACVVGKKKFRASEGEPVAYVHRALRNREQEVIGTLPAQGLFPEGDGKVRCENLLDVLPVSDLHDGKYAFHAALKTPKGEWGPTRGVKFAVGPAESLEQPPGTEPETEPTPRMHPPSPEPKF